MGSPIIWNGSYAKNLLNAQRLGGLSADPSGPAAGDLYYNTTINQFKFYSGSAWVAIAASAPTALRYFGATATVTGSDSLLTYSTVDFDTNSAYASGTFTVPTGAAGQYQINARVILAATFALNNVSAISIYVNGSIKSEELEDAAASVTNISIAVNDIMNLAVGDTVQIKVRCAGVGPTIAASNTENFVSIARVGNSSASAAPIFVSYTNASQTVANTTNVIYANLIKDTNSAYNASTGVFTAPQTRYYAFGWSAAATGGQIKTDLSVNGTPVATSLFTVGATAAAQGYHVVFMNLGDTAAIVNNAGGSFTTTATATDNRLTIISYG